MKFTIERMIIVFLSLTIFIIIGAAYKDYIDEKFVPNLDNFQPVQSDNYKICSDNDKLILLDTKQGIAYRCSVMKKFTVEEYHQLCK